MRGPFFDKNVRKTDLVQLVRDGRLELPTSCSQSKRATNCANPGFLVIEFCSRCGQTCGQAFFLTTSTCGGSVCIAGVLRDCGHGIFRLEGGAIRSQTRRDTNFAIPGYSLFCHDTTASGKNKVFSVCGHSCGQSRFYAVFNDWGKSHKCRCHKAFRRFALLRPGYRHGTPKAGALPTALHPDMKLWGGPGVFSQKRFSAFFIVVYSNLSSFLLQPSYFLAILFPLFPCIPALSVVLHVVSGKVSARIPAPQ